MVLVARAQRLLEVQKRGQPRAKRQNVTAEIRACPIRLTYASNVRRIGHGERFTRRVWLVEIRLLATKLDPWLLLTDWELVTEAQVLRIFQMYRQRWGWKTASKLRRTVWAGRKSNCWIWRAFGCWWCWRGWWPAFCTSWA